MPKMRRMRRRVRAAAVPLVAVVVAGSVVTLGVISRGEPDKPGGATGQVTPIASPSAPDPGVVDVTSAEQKKAAGEAGAGAGVQVAPDGRSVSVNLGELAPVDSTMALALPRSTKNSWDLVSRLMPPQTGLAGLDLSASPASAAVGVLAYAQAPSNGDRYAWTAGGTVSAVVDVLYLATASAQDAETTSAWLQQQNLAVAVATTGPLVVVTPNWVSPTAAMSGDHLSTNVRYRESLSRLARSSTNTLWLDVPSYLDRLTSARSEEYHAAMKDFFTAALGGSQSTDQASTAQSLYFVASSTDDAYSWSGLSSTSLGDALDPQAADDARGELAGRYAPSATDPGGIGVVEGKPIPQDITFAMDAQTALTLDTKSGARLGIDLSKLTVDSSSGAYWPNISGLSVAAGDSDRLNVVFTPSQTLTVIGQGGDPSGQASTPAPAN